MNSATFRYWVSYFCELNLSAGGLGIDFKGHMETGIFELDHPLISQDDVVSFIQYLSQQENKKSTSGRMWKIHLLGFSLMYINQDEPK